MATLSTDQGEQPARPSARIPTGKIPTGSRSRGGPARITPVPELREGAGNNNNNNNSNNNGVEKTV